MSLMMMIDEWVERVRSGSCMNYEGVGEFSYIICVSFIISHAYYI